MIAPAGVHCVRVRLCDSYVRACGRACKRDEGRKEGREAPGTWQIVARSLILMGYYWITGMMSGSRLGGAWMLGCLVMQLCMRGPGQRSGVEAWAWAWAWARAGAGEIKPPSVLI